LQCTKKHRFRNGSHITVGDVLDSSRPGI